MEPKTRVGPGEGLGEKSPVLVRVEEVKSRMWELSLMGAAQPPPVLNSSEVSRGFQ